MINYWWVTRPKRKLNSVPEVLTTFAELSLNQTWDGQRSTHLSLEDALEQAGLKRKGDRRDQRGGGGRTYKAWLVSLGLIFTQEATSHIQLTLAGEAIMNGDSPVDVLKNQVFKYQFPSSFSLSRNVEVSRRFKIHPFVFLLRLMMDSRINYLETNELANIVIVEAENETDACYENVVSRLLQYRKYGASVLPADFNEKYGVKPGSTNLFDVANTMMNWLDYTQLTIRDTGKMYVVPEKKKEAAEIISRKTTFIDRPENHEYFQRKYGIDPKHTKDTRNLLQTKTVTEKMIAEQQIIKSYILFSLQRPISRIDSHLIHDICNDTGIYEPLVIEVLQRRYPHGSVSSFMTKYYEMAFNGRDDAAEFEKATAELFKEVFGFKTEHVGPIGLTPDVLLISEKAGYAGIIDNKAYSKYSISNDHHNRMVHNYIEGLQNYYSGNYPLKFFSYIAGGFGPNINSQIRTIIDETGVHGSCINVHNIIELVQRNEKEHYTNEDIAKIFTVDRQILMTDF